MQYHDPVQQLRELLNIVDVIIEYGVGDFPNLNPNTPFKGSHGTHPSSSQTNCSVDPIHNRWYCFSCKQGGGPLEWILHAEYNGDRDVYAELVANLCTKYEIPIGDVPINTVKYGLYQILTRLTLQYHDALMANPEAKAWVMDKYHFTEETLQNFHIGWCDSEPKEHASFSELASVGMINDKGMFIWNNHITIPYYKNAVVQWMTARYMGDPPSGIPKYRALDANPNIYPCLFNYDRVLKGNTKYPLLICEGPIDAISASQNEDIALAVGSNQPKAELVPELLKLGRDYLTKYIAMDSEKSGIGFEGAKRTARIMISGGQDPRIINLPRPDGTIHMDLNEFLNHYDFGPVALEKMVRHNYQLPEEPYKDPITGKDIWIETLPDMAIRECPRGAEADRVRDVIDTFCPMPDIQTNAYARKLAHKLGVAAQKIDKMVSAARKKQEKVTFTINEKHHHTPYLAQDYVNYKELGTWHAHRTVYASVTSRVTKGGVDHEENIMTPIHIVVDLPATGGHTLLQHRIVNVAAESDAFLQKLPDAAIVNHEDTNDYAWSFATRHPYSITNFLEKRSPEIDAGKLYTRVRGLFQKYIKYPDERDADVLTCFTLFTYLFMGFDAAPYIHCNGIASSGKSTTLDLLGNLCFNTVNSVSISGAGAFRIIHNNRGTLIIDEAENLRNPSDEAQAALRTICLAGYTKSKKSSATRLDSANNMQAKLFNAYGPKVFGSIKSLGHVFASRTIQVHCLPAKREEWMQLGNLTQDAVYLKGEFQELRDILQIWSLTQFRVVREVYDTITNADYPDLASRDSQLWWPLLAIANVVGKTLGENLDAMLYECAKAKQRQTKFTDSFENFELAVIRSLYDVFTDDPDALYHKEAEGEMWYAAATMTDRIINNLMREGSWDTKKNSLNAGQLVRMLKNVGAVESTAKAKTMRMDLGGETKPMRCVVLDFKKVEQYLREKGLRDDDKGVDE